MLKEFRRQAASPSCHPSRGRMDLSDLEPHLMRGLLGPHESPLSSPPNASLSLRLFFRTPQQRLPVLFSGAGNPKIAVFSWMIWIPSSTWVLGPTTFRPPNGILIGSIVFTGLTNVTNRHRHTDRPTAALRGRCHAAWQQQSAAADGFLATHF